MRVLVFLSIVPFVLAGCAGAEGPAAPTVDGSASQTAAPERVAIHDEVDLVQGGQRTWTFVVEPGATTVEMRFFATGKGVPSTGLPTCLTIETPAGQATAGSCQGGQNVNLAPSVIVGERVFYEHSGTDAPVGTYTFTLDAQPNTTDFHAMVTVAYD